MLKRDSLDFGMNEIKNLVLYLNKIEEIYRFAHAILNKRFSRPLTLSSFSLESFNQLKLKSFYIFPLFIVHVHVHGRAMKILRVENPPKNNIKFNSHTRKLLLLMFFPLLLNN